MKRKEFAVMKINWDDRNEEWRMAKNMGMAQGPGKYPSMTVEKEEQGEIYFVIQSPKGVTFAQDALVPKGKANPADFADQIEVVDGEGTDTLHVRSMNSSREGGIYTYALNFSDGKTLDPIIQNNGCCRPLHQNSLVQASVGILLAVAATYFVTKRFFS